MFEKVFDLSLSLGPKTPVYPGDPDLGFKPLAQIDSDGVNMMSLDGLSTHVGTHIDPPLHFVKGGKSIDMYSADTFIMPAKVFTIKSSVIDAETLADLPILPGEAVLFHTMNSDQTTVDPSSAVYVSKSGAEYLVTKKVKLAGIDYVTIDRIGDDSFPAHKTLLTQEIFIVENLYLKEVPDGEYTLICLPLKIENGDGSPVRAILVK